MSHGMREWERRRRLRLSRRAATSLLTTVALFSFNSALADHGIPHTFGASSSRQGKSASFDEPLIVRTGEGLRITLAIRLASPMPSTHSELLTILDSDGEDLVRLRINSIRAVQVLHPDQVWRLVGWSTPSSAWIEVTREGGGYTARLNEDPPDVLPVLAAGEPARVKGALEGELRFLVVRASSPSGWGTTIFRDDDAIAQRGWQSSASEPAGVGNCRFILAGNTAELIYAGETPGCARVFSDSSAGAAARFERSIEDLGDAYIFETRFARFDDPPATSLTVASGLRDDGSAAWAIRLIGHRSVLILELTGPDGAPRVIATGSGSYFRTLRVAADEASGRLAVSLEQVLVHDAIYDPAGMNASSVAFGDLSPAPGDGTGSITVSEAWVQGGWTLQDIV